MEFLTHLHQHMGIPLCGVLQGRYVDEGSDDEQTLPNCSIKFPVDIRYLEKDPDVLFASEFVEVFYVRDISEDEVMTTFDRPLTKDSVITVYRKQGWNFLRDMGYVVEERKYAGRKVACIGEEAKDAYLTHMAPRVSTLRVTSEISLSQLAVLGIIPSNEGVDFTGSDIADTTHMYVDLQPLRSYTLSGPMYFDLDLPREPDIGILDYGPDQIDLLWRRQVITGDQETDSILV
jgi:hypothetical protein